jgi:hypothetical protein
MGIGRIRVSLGKSRAKKMRIRENGNPVLFISGST